MGNTLLRAEGVEKTFRSGAIEVQALRGIDLDLSQGEFAALKGPSGSGKSTLLHLFGGLDLPSKGTITLGGTPVTSMSGRELSDFRRDHIGFVFQAYNLIPVLTVTENIEYVMMLQGVPREERRERVAAILAEVGLAGLERRFPPQLSGGQQQRVAVARAIVARPDLILADEPTANLDSLNAAALLELMAALNRDHKVTFLFSTHDEAVFAMAKRLITLKDGRIEADQRREGAA